MPTGNFGGGATHKTLVLVFVSLVLFGLFHPVQCLAQTFTELYAFNSTGNLSDGGWPEAGVVRDAAGNLYGTTFFGGLGTGCDIDVAGCGIVFKVDAGGNETVLHAFGGTQDGWNPTAGLVLDSAGNLYGTTLLGGAHGFGVVFKIDLLGNETILHSFTRNADGANPNSSLAQDTASNLYGTPQYGGRGCDRHGCGTIFRITPSGDETVLYQFHGIDGASPLGGVVVDGSGNVYGTTWLGGLYGFGTVFKIDGHGNETVLHNFSAASDGANPMGTLVLDAAGNIYGTTSAGGNSYFGTLFMIDTAGNESVLYNFTGGNDGAYPYSNLILDAQGNLYGTTSQGGSGQGTVFEFSNGTLNTLYSFSAPINGMNSDGQNPMGGVTADANGNLYGTAVSAGSWGWGSVFEIQLGAAAAK